jgi:hypothetical protein
MEPFDDVADGADRLELGRLDSPAGILLQLHDEIDRVDAVEIEIFVQLCLERDLLCRYLEHLA